MARDPDFGPAGDELHWAVDALTAALAGEGEPGGAGPRASEALAALPAALPETGLGGRAALEALAGPWLGGAARLGHPGFLAHMTRRRRGPRGPRRCGRRRSTRTCCTPTPHPWRAIWSGA